jgi:anti-anti-sigma factor
MLSFTVNNLGDVAIFECTGRITVEDGDALRNAVLRQPYVQVVVLDFKGITKVDAAGLGVLASLRGWAKATGAELKLMNVSPRLEKLLELTGLKPVLTICSAREMLDLWCRALHYSSAPAAASIKRAAGF